MGNCVLCGSETDSSNTVFPVCRECSAESNQETPSVSDIEIREPQSQNYPSETSEQNLLVESPEQESRSLKGLERDLDHLSSFLKSLRGSRSKFGFLVDSFLWMIERSGRGNVRHPPSTTDTRTHEMAEARAHKDKGAGHVIGGILFIIGGFWSIALGDAAPDAGIMIIVGIGIIVFGVALSLFGVVRFFLSR